MADVAEALGLQLLTAVIGFSAARQCLKFVLAGPEAKHSLSAYFITIQEVFPKANKKRGFSLVRLQFNMYVGAEALGQRIEIW